MTFREPVACSLMLLTVVAGCRRQEESPPPEPEEVVELVVEASRAGRLRRVEVGLLFTPCGDPPGGGLLVANTPELLRLLAGFGDPAEGVTVLTRIDGLEITALRYIGLEGPDCTRLPPDGRLVARGNEPFWNARIDDDRIVMTTPEEMDGVTYEDATWHRTDDGYRVEAMRPGEPPLALDVQEVACIDSMSGAVHPYRVVLSRQSRVVQGCAIEGRLATGQLPLAIIALIPAQYFDRPPEHTTALDAAIDLDGDGREERVVHLRSSPACDPDFCPTLVFTPVDDGFRLVSAIALTRPPILASTRRSNDWRNLIVRVPEPGEVVPVERPGARGQPSPERPGTLRELAFDGLSYPADPTTPLAPAAGPTADATSLIPTLAGAARIFRER